MWPSYTINFWKQEAEFCKTCQLLSIVLGLNLSTWNLVGDIDMNNSQIAPAIL